MVEIGQEISELKSTKELVIQELTLKSSSVEELLLELKAKNELLSNLESTSENIKLSLVEASTRIENLESNIKTLDNLKTQSEEEREKVVEVANQLTLANKELKDSLSRYNTVCCGFLKPMHTTIVRNFQPNSRQ
jgi:chromosome segregation ATPase